MHRERGLSNRDFFTRELFPTTPRTILEDHTAQGADGKVYYAAVRDDDTGEVWALVVLMHWGRGHFNLHYKEMDDTCGPAERECPQSILERLTPTENTYALDWRADCWANAQKAAQRPKVRKGSRIKLSTPAFWNGLGAGEVLVAEDVRRNVFRRVGGQRVKLQGFRTTPDGYEVLPETQQQLERRMDRERALAKVDYEED